MSLRWGQAQPLSVREEHVELPGASGFHLLYASDLHLTGPRTEVVCQYLEQAARSASPDAVLLGGDLVDSKNGPSQLGELVRALTAHTRVLAVAGNHDQFWGVEPVRQSVVEAGGEWLHDEPACLQRGATRLRVDGAPLPDLAVDLPRLLCAHNPEVFPKAMACGYRLVLAGHLHGGQWVWFERNHRLYPGAWLWKWNGLRFHEQQTTLLVSRGVGDTLPLRWNCPRELIACRLE